MKILVINGPNLNLLGYREPELYGSVTYDRLCSMIGDYCIAQQIEVSFYQSNHEGALVDAIQSARDGTDGIVINAGAYTHTSIALLDALQAVQVPAVEVHISDLSRREAFRQISYLRSACIGCIIGHGVQGYIEAIALLQKHLQ